jgi:protein MPE1
VLSQELSPGYPQPYLYLVDMSSSVHFKFKSQKEPSRVTFDGTAISVFDLKRDIIQMNKLGDGTDFELAVYNEGDNTEYDDDTTLIPRSTSVIARRLPAVRPGRGRAARYVSGKAPINARHASGNESTKLSAQSRVKGPDMNTAQTEEERVKAMFSLEGEQWRLKQQEMAS